MIKCNKKNENTIYYNTITQGSIVIVFVLTLLSQIVVADSSLLNSLQKLKIPSDIVPSSNYIKQITVQLNNEQVKPGDQVPLKKFKSFDLNKISWEISDDSRHTLLLVDLDRRTATGSNVTSQQQPNIYNQFTSINIPTNIISGGQIVVAFDPPNVPCTPSSKHRILMLAYQQSQNIDLADVASLAAPTGYSPRRENFKLYDFVNRHRLELVAANVFWAYDEVSNGLCSGSISFYSLQGFTSILIAMVTLSSFIGLSSERRRSNWFV